jgi:hypothetical protein
MKPIIPIVAFAGLFSMAACNTSALREKEAAIQMQQHTIDSMNMELAKKKAMDSLNELARMQYVVPPAQYAGQGNQVVYVHHYYPARSTASHRSYARSSTRSYSGYNQPVAYQQPRRRGWSAKAKGAVIGGAGGAIAGAIINKRNRPVGALIGGVLGAGAGTGIGAIIDHRNGR